MQSFLFSLALQRNNLKSSIDRWVLVGGTGFETNCVGFNFMRLQAGLIINCCLAVGVNIPSALPDAEGSCLQTSALAERRSTVLSMFFYLQRVVFMFHVLHLKP